MDGHRAYLDYNASAPLLDAAREAMGLALDCDANPSSVHGEGRTARRLIEDARRAVASLANAIPDHVVFTSGATEAAATLLTPNWRMGRGVIRMARLYVAASDHPCILGGGRFRPDQIETIGIDGNGVIDLAELADALAKHDSEAGLPMVAIHHANNETGVVQPVAEIAAFVHGAGGVFVLDAVQSAGRISLDITEGSVDFLILSSHKIGGPKGAGAIVGASDLLMPEPLVTGGGQEKGHRAGTENVAAIAGFGAAAAEALASLGGMAAVGALRSRIESAIRSNVDFAEIYGEGAERLSNTVFFAIPDMAAETLQIAFDLAGVAVSAGSACSSGKVGPSHVLKAMGRAGESALRVSIGRGTTDADIALFEKALAGIVARQVARKEKAA
ncbi:aminotransferase class V-fold PLP-dependent enzyme [Mesorhizobium sp. NBSH29]|uniref:cysteine desulfurase family protein n=1 Tax=Mesorhizobium sp. NBSH29 TaxID=2654249 RepID=UPI001896862D|nr:cysteine desulfurase family protein [Mesorhizobium sp. NBSH29]QPC87646.1 aminotransferase class V-fold PLP-dependent enzyme [Mesorhizobium sp. NBSH29]